MADWQKIGTALQGMGEGFAGRGAQWQAAQARAQEAEAFKAAQERRLEMERQNAQQQQAKLIQSESGQLAGYTLRQMQRQLESGQSVSPDTLKLHLRGMAGSGANPAALNDLAKVVMNPETQQEALRGYIADVAPMFGMDKKPDAMTNVVTGNDGKRYGLKDGRMVEIPSPEGVSFGGGESGGMTEYQREQVRLRAAQLEFDKAKAEAAENRLPPALLEYQLEEDKSYQSAVAAAASAKDLAQSYRESGASAGAAAVFEEFVKDKFGSEDGVTQMRQQYTKLRNSMVLGDLPPGVASDKDIEIAMSGYPKATANPEYVESFLNGMAKLNRFRAAQALYNKNYLSANRTVEKKDRYWKAPIKISDDYTTNLAEIYYSAMEEGLTVKEMLDLAGVTDPNILKRIGY